MTQQMDAFYTPAQKAMQDAQGSAKLAKNVFEAIVSDVVEGPNAGFIESRDFFFLSTVDNQGRPTVSHKGGPPGVCAVLGPKELAFPTYDGNGMFKSMGNAVDTGQVGLLFIDFETPNRVRVQGRISVSADDTEIGRWPGALMVARVAVESCFLNCARYIHKHTRVAASPYVPSPDGTQPHPAWKRIDTVQEALPDTDRIRTADAGGSITQDEYVEKLLSGNS